MYWVVAKELSDAVYFPMDPADFNPEDPNTWFRHFRPKDEQEIRLKEVFERYARLGGVWTPASLKVSLVSLPLYICGFVTDAFLVGS